MKLKAGAVTPKKEIDLYLRALTEVPWPPTSTTFCYLYLSSALPLGISRLHIPAFCTLFYCLVGLKTGNLCVFAPAAGSPLPLLIQATWWDSLAIELIYQLYGGSYLHLESAGMLW
jgi:hypothetical protein